MNKLQKFFGKKILGLDDEQFQKLTEAIVSIDTDDYLYRRYGMHNTKGLTQLARDQQLKLAFNAYATDPLAKFILDTKIDFVCGDGFSYSFSVDIKKAGVTKEAGEKMAEMCMEVIDEFWAANNMDWRFEKKILDQRLNGMLILTVFINKFNGAVKIGFIDPQNLDKVITNEMNVEDILQVKLKGVAGNSAKVIPVIREDDEPSSPTLGMLKGETFYFAINNVSNQPEGLSDLLCNLDTLDIMKKVLFKIIKVIDVHLAYIQHVKVKGGDAGVKKFKKDNPFTIDIQRMVTDKDTEVDIFNPDLKNLDITEIIRLLKNFTLGSQRFPESWFADGSQTNLATAKEQDEPTIKMFSKIQMQVVYILQMIIRFCLEQAIINNRQGFKITKEQLKHISINIKRPELERRDFKKTGDAVLKVQEVLSKAVASNLLSQKTAQEIFISVLDLFGHDIDKDTELELIEEDIKTKKENNPNEPTEPKGKTKTEEPPADGE